VIVIACVLLPSLLMAQDVPDHLSREFQIGRKRKCPFITFHIHLNDVQSLCIHLAPAAFAQTGEGMLSYFVKERGIPLANHVVFSQTTPSNQTSVFFWGLPFV